MRLDVPDARRPNLLRSRRLLRPQGRPEGEPAETSLGPDQLHRLVGRVRLPRMQREVVFWDAAVEKSGEVRDEFTCPHCNARLTKRYDRAGVRHRHGSAINQDDPASKAGPGAHQLHGWKVTRRRSLTILTALLRIESRARLRWSPWYSDRMPEGEESRPQRDAGITHVHHFYTKSESWVAYASLSARCGCKARLAIVKTSLHPHVLWMQRTWADQDAS